MGLNIFSVCKSSGKPAKVNVFKNYFCSFSPGLLQECGSSEVKTLWRHINNIYQPESCTLNLLLKKVCSVKDLSNKASE